MERLNNEKAIWVAESFVFKKYRNEKGEFNFNLYYVRVGEAMHDNSLQFYGEALFDGEMWNLTQEEVKKKFYKECDFTQEYLIQVKCDFSANNFKSTVVSKPND